jgi:chorismate dehydratase
MWTIGAVPYLNARTLVAPLYGRPDVRIVEAVPSRLARMLAAGEVDAAMVSSVIGLSEPGAVILDAPGVTSFGPVASIRLFASVAPEDIRTLALDTSSRTGVVLGQLLLHRVYSVRPSVVSCAPDVPAMLAAADACVIIGDPALRAAKDAAEGRIDGVRTDLDLGTVWTELTGLPFVFAVWTARAGGDICGLEALLRKAAAEGDARRDDIARAAAAEVGLSEDECVYYLRHNVKNVFGAREREGLELFRRWAEEDGLLAPSRQENTI